MAVSRELLAIPCCDASNSASALRTLAAARLWQRKLPPKAPGFNGIGFPPAFSNMWLSCPKSWRRLFSLFCSRLPCASWQALHSNWFVNIYGIGYSSSARQGSTPKRCSVFRISFARAEISSSSPTIGQSHSRTRRRSPASLCLETQSRARADTRPSVKPWYSSPSATRPGR